MRAMVIPRFGGPHLFEERDVERPQPGPGEVLVRVIAAGTNPVDAKLRAGGGSRGLEAPVILGADVSGIVEEAGPGVTDLAPGDEVYYTPEVFGPGANGAYAEYNVAQAEIVARKPASLSHEEAAAVPLAGGTAYEAIVRRLGVQVGETVLIHGGAGGVGSFAVQIANSAGARVLATAGPDNQELLDGLGADVTIDYTQQDVAQGALTPLYQRNQTLHGVLHARERARLREMTKLIERGQMRPVVDQVLDLREVGRAHERLDSGHGRGKIVLRVAEG